VIILLAAALRIIGLGARPLRGDEAFAVRYWAQPLALTLEPRDGLAWREPHPLGVFFAFFTWKSLAGDSEFAMRALPALVNLLGVPAMYGLARQLFRAPRFGLAGALLWALNPNLIWHSQDARDYAMWAALSAVSLWLLVRLSRREVRRADAALCVVASIVAFYTFFLEAFLAIVHGLYLALTRVDRLRLWLGLMLIVVVALLPWAGQAAALARSGYQGALTGTAGDTPWRMLAALLYGETLPGVTEGSVAQPFAALALVGLFLVAFGWMAYEHRRAGALVALALTVPFLLLALAATRLDVFGPRYLMGATPALLLPWAFALAATWGAFRKPRRARLVSVALAALVVVALVVPTGFSLARYVSADYHKAPDWFALRDYLTATVQPGDGLIVSAVDARTGAIDPAFEYYYRGPTPFLVLPYPGADVNALVARELESRQAVWLVVGSTSGEVDAQLRAQGVLISDDGAGRSFLVRQYRAQAVKPGEIEAALNLSAGELSLQGYAITGPRRTGAALSVLLFWNGTPPAGLSTFVHLIGPTRPDGSPLWAQDDHPPAAPGRDVYRLDLRGVPPGDYHVEIGLYDPDTGQRAPLHGQSGRPAGESVVLEAVRVTE
jgi:4-amino-4-deoxy-L-arabinose transferase-like glycosyltransferase